MILAMTPKSKASFLNYFLVTAMFFMAVDLRVFSGFSGFVSFTVLELLIYVGCAYIFLSLVANPYSYWQRIKNSLQAARPLIIFLVFATIATFLALLSGRIDGLQLFKDLLPSILLALILVFAVDDINQLKKLTIIFVLVGFVSALLGVSQGLLGGPYPFPVDISSLGKMGLDGKVLTGNVAIGFFRHPNGLGVYLVPIFVGFFVALFSDLTVVKKIFCFFSLLLVCIVFYYAQVKGAFAWSLIGGLSGLAILKFGDKLSIWILALFPGIIFIIVYASLTSNEQTLSTMQTRYQLWQAAMYVFSRFDLNFFVGSLREEMYTATNYFTMGRFPYPNAHNAYLNIVINYGVLALLAYVFMIVHVVKSCPSISPNMSIYNAAYKGAFLGLLGQNFFEPTAEGVLVQSQFYILVAAILIVKKLQKVKSHG
ncbi:MULTISPECIES: O-antigen ligase family protein [Deefgea]|uniref:O-antigen polymerase n=1 Tax=Deefgea chitinilytica TaxID=570276 RepID=A0ABS2CFC4_9NEIS|nr:MULTISPECIES: hypothetical protein [Deefgea]MBM5572350.1 hypothetical protein [Deefgea chitinilytica]MBM9889586.1 hypothetical protein [Deefgea sp. CFH1-16]